MSMCSSELLHNFPSDLIRVITENRTVSNRSPTSLIQRCTEHRWSPFPLPQLSQTAGTATATKGESSHTTCPVFSLHTRRYGAIRVKAPLKVTTQHKPSFMQGVLPEICNLIKILQRFLKSSIIYFHIGILHYCLNETITPSTGRLISQTGEGILVTCQP